MPSRSLRLSSTIAAVAAGCLSAMLLFWSVFSIALGGPDSRVGHEAILIGIISAIAGLILAYAMRFFYAAPARLTANPASRAARFALYGSPLFALACLVLLWMVGPLLLLYFVFTLMVVLTIQMRKKR